MFSGSLLGVGLPMVSPHYYVLIEFVVGVASFIFIWVSVMMCYQILFHRSISMVEGERNFVEFMWTFLPSVVVLLMSVLNVKCFESKLHFSGYSGVKVVGRQWYWSYGLPHSEGVYDSVIGDFVDGVDKPLRLHMGEPYCFYVTSADVIHSFSVPFLSIKVDAVPGRINQFYFVPDLCGRHVGYCSELCGAGHAYMPIVIEILPLSSCLS